MTQVHFRCSNAQGEFIDPRSTAIADLAELRDHASSLVRSLVMKPGKEDWRDWCLFVADDLGELILVVPFASVLGKPH
ncbi:MAG: hypothetical protein HY852_03210 [Bradyrhizobium sp.]|uniref:DUF6894 family protein n=1 Tax=Bradyrhizobium sp. TaxID=376 RepID=UPI0025C38012|nr:hypothetical protein [Bradyrhizobium sp.]MBI5260811.1 hypothetical protein [Bradyrhizobium sp.]